MLPDLTCCLLSLCVVAASRDGDFFMMTVVFSMESTSAGLSSFVDIDNLVQRTAAMTRSALDNSPLHPRHGHRSARETSHLLCDTLVVAVTCCLH